MKLLTDGKQGIQSAKYGPNVSNNQTDSTTDSITCHLLNYEDDEKYYKNVQGQITAGPQKCKEECFTRCQICWSADNCVPVCEQAQNHKIEGFAPVECAKPFYFCNAGLSINTLEVMENGNIKKITKPFHGMIFIG